MMPNEALEIITNAVQADKMTVEQDKALAVVQKALEKQIPQSKRAPFDTEAISCGNCDSDISDTNYTYCPYCGQKLDWTCLEDNETTFECDGKTYIVEFDEENNNE